MRRRLCRLLFCNLLIAWILTGCSTPGSRAHGHTAALHRLSPADQQLVLHGRVRPGLSQEAVYIAWGGPDEKTVGSEGKSASETWVYRQRVTLSEPMNSYYYSGPFHGLGGGEPRRGFLPAYAYGGIGYEGMLHYQPHVRSLDSVRVVEFSGGELDRYKGADGLSCGCPLATTLTAVPIDRRLPHVSQRSALKVCKTVRHQHPAATVGHHSTARFHGSVRQPPASRHLVARHVFRLHRHPGKSG